RALSGAKEVDQELKLLEIEITKSRASLAEIDRALMEKKAEAARAADNSQSVVENSTVLRKSLETLKSRQLETLGQLTELRNESLKVEKEIELLARQEVKFSEQLEREKSLLRAKEESLALIMNLLAEEEKTKAEKQVRAGELEASLERSRAAVESLRAQVEKITKEHDKDGYRLQALKKLEETQAVTNAPSDIPEVLGRLADLIDADPDSAALIDSLWKEEAGVAVIPALDFIKHAEKRKVHGRFLLVSPRKTEPSSLPPIDDPRVLGYLKSRLRPSPKIRDFMDRLGEAVIVRDVRSAVELWLSFPSLNFITPEGDLLLSNGLLKVGRREEGIFALGREVKELAELQARREEELAPLAGELEKKLEEVKGLEEELDGTMALLHDTGIKIHEHEKMKIAEGAEREKVAGALSLLEKELEVLRRDGEALRQAKNALAEKIAALEEGNEVMRGRLEEEEKDFALHQGRNLAEEKRLIQLRADTALLEERASHVSRQIAELSERQENIRKKAVSFLEEKASAEREALEARRSGAALETQFQSLEEKKKLKQAELSGKESDRQRKRSDVEELEKRLADLREELEKRKEERVKREIVKAEVDRDMVNLEETCWQELKKTLHEVKNERPEVELSDAEIEDQLSKAEEDLQKIKSVNLMAEEEYISHKERYDFLVQQRDDLRQSIDATQEAIHKIDDESQTQFLTALAEVNKSFQEVFNLLFKGGSAEVKLLDPSNPQESGVEITAQPPGKKVQNVLLLSGGEKSLTSLAFLFALFRYKPTPFCILDEVDAALDDVNLARFLDLMKNIKQDTQFIIITHNYKTMEVADYIYGTTMAEPNITTLYSVKLEKQPELVS
ncbi:MAG: AAA family ATPase, partial [Acidobacteriota bacterium]